MAKIEK